MGGGDGADARLRLTAPAGRAKTAGSSVTPGLFAISINRRAASLSPSAGPTFHRPDADYARRGGGSLRSAGLPTTGARATHWLQPDDAAVRAERGHVLQRLSGSPQRAVAGNCNHQRRRAPQRAAGPFDVLPGESNGGGYEIRTREGLPPTRFPSVRPRPLGESSAANNTRRQGVLANTFPRDRSRVLLGWDGVGERVDGGGLGSAKVGVSPSRGAI